MEQTKQMPISILDNNLNDSVTYQQFFHAFGYSDDDRIYLRDFSDKEKDEGHNSSVILRYFDSRLPELHKINEHDRGIFFVVNGDGTKDEHVKHARAQFMEIDPSAEEMDAVAAGKTTITEVLSKQLKKIKAFPLTPSIIVMTRKSLHCYWLLDNGEVRFFRELQERLIQHFHSDKRIKNESRVMRVYGFEHRKKAPVLVRLIKFNPELRYTQRQLHEVLPGLKKQPTKNNASPSKNPSELIPYGQRHDYVISKCGELVNRMKKFASAETIYATLEADFKENCVQDPPVDMEAFRKEFLKVIKDMMTRGESEEDFSEDWSFNVKAWSHYNNAAFDSSVTSWDEARAAGERARREGLTFKAGSRTLRKKGQKHYHDEFFEISEKGKPLKVIDVALCEWICNTYCFFVMGELPYFLDEYGCYRIDEGGAKMKRLIQAEIIPELCKDSVISSIYRMVLYQDKRKSYDELNQYPVEYVPFRNGFYDPRNNVMIPIRPENYVINQIPHEYDPEAVYTSPIFDSLLQYQLEDDAARELWLEYAGTCFNRDTSAQKWMIIRGRGGTGKSTELNILVHCIGSENVSNETLQGLNEKFNATILFGKLVNICADISSEDMKKIDVLKKITGEDMNGVKFEKKGKDAFFFTPFCKLLFSANEIPLNKDEKSNAFYRRLLITVMDKAPEKIDRNLTKKLRGEVNGIIHRYMEALRRFYDRGGFYPECLRSAQEVKRLRRSADSVIAFLDEELIEDAAGRIERSDLYDAYTAYCEREDRIYPVTRNKLFERLRDEGYTEVKTDGGKRYFMGLRRADEGFSLVTIHDELPFE